MTAEEIQSRIETAANVLRGVCLDPRTHEDARRCLTEQAKSLDEIADHLESTAE